MKLVLLLLAPLQFALDRFADELRHPLLTHEFANPVPLLFCQPDFGLFHA